jgi:hypothetical protein
MYESKHTDNEKKIYEEGYMDGEDHMQLRVFRILQKHMNTHGSYMVIQDLLVKIHQDVAMIPVRRYLQAKPHVIMEHGIRTSNVNLEKNK